MAGELVLYTNPMSRGRVARWMLEETGAPYRVELLEYGGSMKAPAYLAINPMGKVPAIRHGDMVVTEVAAICAYLADAFPEAALAPPPGDPARGAYYRWMFFGAGPLEYAVTNKAAGYSSPPDKKRMFGYGDLDDTLNALEGALNANEYLAGGRFSAADLQIGAALGWYTQFGLVEMRPAFRAYLDRVNARPAKQRAEEKDNALIPKS